MNMVDQTPNEAQGEVLETKMLGAHVDIELYWQFKGEAAKRKESMADAVTHAVRMYLDAKK